jgi:hypothetical protein
VCVPGIVQYETTDVTWFLQLGTHTHTHTHTVIGLIFFKTEGRRTIFILVHTRVYLYTTGTVPSGHTTSTRVHVMYLYLCNRTTADSSDCFHEETSTMFARC